ncbi:MAG TPA: hypothetical protein VI076_06025 [Actinopolymorphaceae bacterium]
MVGLWKTGEVYRQERATVDSLTLFARRTNLSPCSRIGAREQLSRDEGSMQVNEPTIFDEEFSRRRLFGVVGTVGAVGTGVVLGSAGSLVTAAPADAHGTIRSYPGIWGQRTVYEVSGDLASFGYRPSFHDRLNSWLQFWANNTPARFGRPMRIWSYGAHYDGRPTEAHNNGRGFDITRIVTWHDGTWNSSRVGISGRTGARSVVGPTGAATGPPRRVRTTISRMS